MEATAQMVQSNKRTGFAEFAARVTAGASALMLLVLLVFKWYEARYELNIPGLDVSDLGGEAAKPISATAWQVSFLGKLVVVLAIVALLVAVIHLLLPQVRLPFSAPLALFALGAVMAGLIVLTMLTDPEFAPAPEGFIPGFENNAVKFIYVPETQIGIYVSLAFAGLVTLGGILLGIRRPQGLTPHSTAPIRGQHPGQDTGVLLFLARLGVVGRLNPERLRRARLGGAQGGYKRLGVSAG